MAPLLDVQSGISALLESIEKFAWVSGQQCGLVVIKANCTLGWIKRTTTRTSSRSDSFSLLVTQQLHLAHHAWVLVHHHKKDVGNLVQVQQCIFRVEKGLRELGFFSLEKMGEGRPSSTNLSREWVLYGQN